MKRIQLTILSVAMILLMATPQVTYAKVPLNLKVDDEFTFEITTLTASEKVNGTEYADELPYDEGTKIDVKVDDIDDVDTSSGSIFGASNTYVNYTESIDDEDYATSTWVDGWNDIYIIYLFIAAFAGFGYNDYGDFDAPDSSTFNVTEAGKGTGFPYFATSNVSYYKDLENRFEDYDDDLGDYEGSVDADLSDDEKTFDVQYSLSYSNTTTTSEGDDFSIDISYNLDVVIDLTQSILTRFLIEISVDTALAGASYHFAAGFGFDEAGGFLDNLPFDVPGPSFLVALFAILSLGIIPRFRRRE